MKLLIIPNQQFNNVTVRMCMPYLKHIHMLRKMFSCEMKDFFETVKVNICNHLMMEFYVLDIFFLNERSSVKIALVCHFIHALS